jgi:Arc/MetJ-type ribon-helix-helix transcriptional regulator
MPTVELSVSLVQDIEQRVETTEFETVDEYAEFALQEVLHGVEQLDDTETKDVDEDEVQDRLRSLGYVE